MSAMSAQPGSRGGTAEIFRQEFDHSFARARVPVETAFDDLLAVTIGGQPHILRLAEIAAVHADQRIVPLPSAEPWLIGIVAFRNTLAPTYDLRLVLGYPAGPPPRWMVLARAPSPVGLAFDRFDGHLRVPAGQMATAAGDGAPRLHARGVLQLGELVRPVIDLASVIEAIARKVRRDDPPKER
jgi:chemotaxis signal transduction protein